MAAEAVLVEFGLLGDEDNLRRSAAAVTTADLYGADGRPVPGGLYDPAMGTTDARTECETCHRDKWTCLGHPGALRLAAPVVHPVAIPEVRKWLHVVCPYCGALVVDAARLRAAPGRRLAAAAAADTDGRECPSCHRPHPRIAKDRRDRYSFVIAGPAGERILRPDEIRDILGRVPQAVLDALGVPARLHPAGLVLAVVPVPPNTIRPGVRGVIGEKADYHELTNGFQGLVRRNADLAPAAPGAAPRRGRRPPGELGDERERALLNQQGLYNALVVGAGAASEAKKRDIVLSRQGGALLRRLISKHGRVRGNLLGRRVKDTTRGTISSACELPPDTISIPIAIAQTLQVRETVQPYCRARLAALFANGRRYPGVSAVVKRATGVEYGADRLPPGFVLEDGDQVLRDHVDGDHVLFTRSPVLSRSSYGAQRVQVNMSPDARTIRFNVIVCDNYHADFNHGIRRAVRRA
jgi:DNA-directed RNA polymerase beta' subunit